MNLMALFYGNNFEDLSNIRTYVYTINYFKKLQHEQSAIILLNIHPLKTF
jgi:hypothetical protein